MNPHLRRFLAPFLIVSLSILSGCIQEFDVPEAETVDGKAFVRRCSLCHALPDPTRMEYPKWQAVVKRMAANIKSRNVPPMSDEEQAQILAYLKRNAKPFVFPHKTVPASPETKQTPPAKQTSANDSTAFERAGIALSDSHRPAPDFELSRTDGTQVKLSDYRGKLVLLNFWATWCGPCVEEMPTLERVANSLGPKGLAVLAVSLDTGPASDVTTFAAGYHWQLPILLDPENRSGDQYAVRVMPTTYLIDPQGAILGRAFGMQQWDAPKMVALLESLLSNA